MWPFANRRLSCAQHQLGPFSSWCTVCQRLASIPQELRDVLNGTHYGTGGLGRRWCTGVCISMLLNIHEQQTEHKCLTWAYLHKRPFQAHMNQPPTSLFVPCIDSQADQLYRPADGTFLLKNKTIHLSIYHS